MATKHPDSKGPAWPKFFLRRTDQAVAAAFTGAALLGIVVWCLVQWRLGGRLIDIEQAEPVTVKFEIDLNAAHWPELALLPNIGEQLAKRIVAERVENGPFRDLQDLRRVRGIGPRTLESIEPYLKPLTSLETTAGSPPLIRPQAVP